MLYFNWLEYVIDRQPLCNPIMKRLSKYLLICATTTFAFLVFATNVFYVSGHVNFENDSLNTQLLNLEILVKAEGKIIAQTRVDSSHRYSLSFLPQEQDTFHFLYCGNGFDTTLIKSITYFEEQIVEWDFELGT